nr:signal peptide peptidase SppA [uncultured Merdimonas sp.]
MKKKQIGGLIIAAVLFIAVGISSVLTNTVSQRMLESSVETLLTGNYTFNAPARDYIAIVRVEGTIQEQTSTSALDVSSGYQHTTTLEYIDHLMQDSNNKGILLYVDSPGGTVYESEELYLKLQEYKETTDRPVWDYMAHYAASGGYMVSMASDRIYANPNTVTGSIGVIMSGYDLTGLYEKLGIRYVSITSGANKDSSQLTDEQIAIYQTQVDEYYNKFVNIVAEGRDMSEEDVKALADGRTYTAQQARDNGLIDEISLYEDMKDAMSEELGTDEFYELETPSSVWSSLFAKAEELVPKSDSQILTETAEEMESGVPMYYAEQLQ